jgi:putative DNA primase/helicase
MADSSRHDHLRLEIAQIEQGDRGHATNKIVDWARLRQRLSRPTVDQNHTLEQYLKLSIDAQNRLKDVGSFVGGPFKDGKRKADNIVERSILTLDIDQATPSQIEDLRLGLTDICSFEWFASTTRKHDPEKPRWRLVAPLTRPVSREEYGPLARIVASNVSLGLAESMDAVDDVSYRVAQIMYWPSVCREAQFDTIHNPGNLIDPDEVLTAFGDWQDWTRLPYSEKRGQKRPSTGKKAEIPTAKRGIVGAFCRAYDVPAAIAKFLPDVYKLGDPHSGKPRYTYVHGSSSNGAVVEDGGLFLYSHHGTDPCGDRLVNAFDLVRIHLYGESDKEAKDDTGPTAMPSYKAMEEFVGEDVAVAREMQKAQYDVDSMFDDIDGPAAETPKAGDDLDELLGTEPSKPSTNWMDLLDIDNMGIIKPTLTNVALIVQNDPRMDRVVEWNDFRGEIVTRRRLRSTMGIIPKIPILDPVNGDLWSDRHDDCIRALIEAPAGTGKPGYGLKVSDRDLRGAVDLGAAKRAFHPVREYLEGLRWDGKPRIDSLFCRYLGTPVSPYSHAVSRLTFLGAVTRVMEPGHKFDFVPILEGAQGKRKSTFIAVMARNWFAEIEGDLSDRKRLVEQMQGSWILEIPELSGFGRAEVQAIKALFSARTDKVRLSYDRRAKEFKRQCIFIGSVNDSVYLRDATGGRRFWPVECKITEIDTDALEREIDQVWAEALTVYQQMRAAQPHGTLPLFLVDKLARAEAMDLQEKRRVQGSEDGVGGVIAEWLDRPVAEDMVKGDASKFEQMLSDSETMVRRTETCLMEIWCDCMGKERSTYGDTQARTLGRSMETIQGWKCVGARATPRFGKQKVYRRDGAWHFPFEPLDDLGL